MKIKVLVVEDNLIFRSTLTLFVNMLGFQVIEASDGVEAIDKFLEHQPNIILMDYMMPNKDGYEAALAIKEIDPKAKIIFISGCDDEEKLENLVGLAEAVFLKPIEKSVFDAKMIDMAEKIYNN